MSIRLISSVKINRKIAKIIKAISVMGISMENSIDRV